MILDKLVEKKDILIYADQRIIKLKINSIELNERLRDPSVSKAEKKRIMDGKRKVAGRIRELKTLRYVISNGVLKKKAKEYWGDNWQDLHEDMMGKKDGSKCLNCGYELYERDGLYRGYGCPECHSPLVVFIS